MLYRITVKKVPAIQRFIEDEIKKGNTWAIVEYVYKTFRTEEITCFKSKDEAMRLKPRNSVIVPLSALNKILKPLNDFMQSEEVSIWELHIDLERIRKNYLKQSLLNLKHNTMNEENFGYLKDNLKYLGFGEKQHDVLENHLKAAKESFQMTYKTEISKKPFEAILQFKKSVNSDMYFLNNYHASLERSNGEKMEQTFYLNKGRGVTAKEAYNLLEGRAVHKELTTKAGEPYKAWIQLDFENKGKNNNNEVKQFHENYGYDLKAAVGKYAVAELDGSDKEKSLLHSLEKGNIQSVAVGQEGAERKMFIEANPQFKTVTLYDEHLKRVPKESLEQYQSMQHKNGKEVKMETKQELKEDKKKSVKPSDDEPDLMPKKKTSRRKGMSV
ncbi:MAG: hypothetical protein ACTHK8_08425 [Ginsengibacter sp.]